MLTPEQRQSLDWLAESLTLRPLDRAAIKAALADLDAARTALAPVAKRLGDWRDWPCKASPCAVYLTEPEAAAVLAAAGENEP